MLLAIALLDAFHARLEDTKKPSTVVVVMKPFVIAGSGTHAPEECEPDAICSLICCAGQELITASQCLKASHLGRLELIDVLIEFDAHRRSEVVFNRLPEGTDGRPSTSFS